MSRAFVKEPDGDAADAVLPERTLSEHPQYVTRRGLRKLHEEQQALRTQREQLLALGDDMTAKTQLKQLERDLRYLEHCLQNAIVVATSPSQTEIRFGAAVEVVNQDGTTRQFCIVGEHEACAPTGLISWVSPLARSLIGRRVADVIVWERPAGNVELEITKISYPEWS
jgi:transcription elongation GreA/GreB family factor